MRIFLFFSLGASATIPIYLCKRTVRCEDCKPISGGYPSTYRWETFYNDSPHPAIICDNMIIPAYTPPGDDSDLDDGWEGAQDEDDESDFEECDAHPDQAHDPSISNKTAEVGRVLPVSCGTKFPDSKRLHNALSSNLSSILASNASTGGKHKTDKNEETGETSRSTTAGSTSSGTKSGKKNSGSMSNRTHDLEWWSVIVGLIILLNL